MVNSDDTLIEDLVNVDKGWSYLFGFLCHPVCLFFNLDFVALKANSRLRKGVGQKFST